MSLIEITVNSQTIECSLSNNELTVEVTTTPIEISYSNDQIIYSSAFNWGDAEGDITHQTDLIALFDAKVSFYRGTATQMLAKETSLLDDGFTGLAFYVNTTDGRLYWWNGESWQ